MEEVVQIIDSKFDLNQHCKDYVSKLVHTHTINKDNGMKTWNLLLKDSNLTIHNIFVEGTDNEIDAGGRNLKIDMDTFDNHALKHLSFWGDGRGVSREIVWKCFFDFPETDFEYADGSIGANGYGIKGIGMRAGMISVLVTKQKGDDKWRVYVVKPADSSDTEYDITSLLQYHKPSHNKFFNYTYMRSNITQFRIREYELNSNEVSDIVGKDFSNKTQGTYIRIDGCEDNELFLKAKDEPMVEQAIRTFYGQMDLNVSVKLPSYSDYKEIHPMRFPIATTGYPSMISSLPKFDDITVKSSGNEYHGYFFFTLSEKHQPDEYEDYTAQVPKELQYACYYNGTEVRKDAQNILIFDDNKRFVTSYRFMANNTFYGIKHNNMNIILVAKNKLKNLDRVKHLGFASKSEIKDIREVVQEILRADADGDGLLINPNSEKDKQAEVAQTQMLVENIVDGTGNYRARWMEYVTDQCDVKITTAMVKDMGNYIVTTNNVENNQIDVTFPHILVEVENMDSASSKDHLEKINLWYDEIIQQANHPTEWIVWLCKSHNFQKRLKELLKSKPCTNDNFKGFILLNWKDLTTPDEDRVKCKYVKVNG